VNQGGESGYDDYGLPPVDVVVPDDARELYRDVQAYHRELRALRRQERSLRFRTPFRRSGVALPLIAGCLVAALVAVMVSAMFTANPNFDTTGRKQPTGQAGASAGTSTSASSARPSAATSVSPSHQLTDRASQVPLPTATLVLAGTGQSVRLRTLSYTALAIVPATCPKTRQCTAAVRVLLMKAESFGVLLYLVVPRDNIAQFTRLVPAVHRKTRKPQVATDSGNVLTSKYGPTGLTLLVVKSSGLATVDTGLHGANLKVEYRQLSMLRRAR
jgi:hypothetical protein